MKKLYVGSLPYSVDDNQLEALFAPFGKVLSAKVIMDKMSGRSKGFAFVEMEGDDEAQKAIDGLHGKDFGGRELVVNEARPMEPRHSSGGGSRGGYGDRNRNNATRW